MNTTIIVFAAVCLLAAVVITLIIFQHRERATWSAERRVLVDRIIARHTGEVVALDRQAERSRTERPDPTIADARNIEGLT